MVHASTTVPQCDSTKEYFKSKRTLKRFAAAAFVVTAVAAAPKDDTVIAMINDPVTRADADKRFGASPESVSMPREWLGFYKWRKKEKS